MIAIDPRKTWSYVLKRDRALPADQRTVHQLRHLSVADEHRSYDGLEPSADGANFVRKDLGSDSLRVLRAGYAGISNFKGADGADIPFERDGNGVVTDAFLARLTLGDRMELARAIELELVVTETELEKSGPLST